MGCVGDVGEALARLKYALRPSDDERDNRGENNPVEKHPEKRNQQKSLRNVLKEFEEIAHGSPSSIYFNLLKYLSMLVPPQNRDGPKLARRTTHDRRLRRG